MIIPKCVEELDDRVKQFTGFSNARQLIGMQFEFISKSNTQMAGTVTGVSDSDNIGLEASNYRVALEISNRHFWGSEIKHITIGEKGNRAVLWQLNGMTHEGQIAFFPVPSAD